MFPVSLWLLLLPSQARQGLPEARAAGERAAVIQGGGNLLVDGESFAFKPGQLLVSPGTPKLGRLVKLVGTLRPRKGAPWTFELQVTEKGVIYMLQFLRKEQGRETGRWSPTLKSKVEVLAFRPEPGGEVRLKFSGPLSGILGIAPKQAEWSGELWAEPR
jgi:hypothetical protein